MKNSIRSIVALHIKVHFSPANINARAMEASIDVNTINTDNSIRDVHLRAEDYF
jgi:polyisoprenoid-binding protein YceI